MPFRAFAPLPTVKAPGFRRYMPMAVVTLIVVMIVTQAAGFLYTSAQQEALIALRNDTREVRIVQQALVDKKAAAEDYLLTGDLSHLREYEGAAHILDQQRAAIARLDGARRDTPQGQVAQALQRLDAIWTRSIDLSRQGRGRDGQALITSASTRGLLDTVRGSVTDYLARRNVHGDQLEARIGAGRIIVLFFQVVGGALTLVCLIAAFRSSRNEVARRRAAMADALEAHGRVKILFEMADVLQSAGGYDDAKAVLRASASRLLPHLHGRLYIFNNSRDRLDLLTEWNGESEATPPVAPGECWALKRGKPHVNIDDPLSLTCAHYTCSRPMLEVPMMARGELYGLLTFSSLDGVVPELDADGGIITPLADAMSLALSNIALREKLKNQALRDPLTGLYNRRYMEDMLDRFVLLSGRTGTPVSLVMVDLDHFKRLNDEHGHLLGDTVLRAVGQVLKEGLRETDVACRYGGEELIVLLPDCGLEDAMTKAEALRARVEGLSDIHGVRITASFGVAAAPESAALARDLIGAADAALYESKRGGRNRVTSAGTRGQLSLAAE